MVKFLEMKAMLLVWCVHLGVSNVSSYDAQRRQRSEWTGVFCGVDAMSRPSAPVNPMEPH